MSPNLYSSSLEYRNKVYNVNRSIQQANITNDYLLNNQMLFDERMMISSYEAFNKNSELLKGLEKRQLRLTGEEQMYLTYPEEKKKMLAIEADKKHLALKDQERKYILGQNIPQIEGMPRQSPSPALTPKSGISTPDSTARVTPRTFAANESDRAAQAANIALIDRTSDIYKAFRDLPRAKKSGLPKRDDMIAFAQLHNMSGINALTDASAKVLAEQIMSQMPKKQEGSGLGLLKRNRKKYRC